MVSSIGFRYVIPGDRPLMEQWIAKDPDHRFKGMCSDFFFTPGTMSFVIFDEDGPALFVRVDPEPPESARVHIQFSDNEVRSAKAMLRGWPEFMERVYGCGIRRMVFESNSPKLINFCQRCFGFQRVGTSHDYELVKEVECVRS